MLSLGMYRSMLILNTHTWYVMVLCMEGLPHTSSSALSHMPSAMFATPRMRAGFALKENEISEDKAKVYSHTLTHM